MDKMRKYFRKILSKRVKKILIGLAAGTVIVTGLALSPLGKIELCTPNKCQYLTQNEYQNLKLALVEKSESGAELTYEEYNLLIKIYDFEIKNRGGLKFENVRTEDLLARLNQIIKTKVDK